MISIRRYQVLILTSIITLVCFSAAIQGYRSSMNEAETVFDHALISMAKLISKVEIKSPIQATNSPFIKNDEYFAYQVWQKNTVILKTDNTPDIPLSSFKTGFSDENFSNNRWRVYTYFDGSDSERERWVFTAQLIERRVALAEVVTLSAVAPLILSIPFLALLIYLIVNRSLKPLHALSVALTNKKADDLTPVVISHDSKELSPVISTLNHLLRKLDLAFNKEKRFASDAAHELRTPLSVLKVTLHNLTNENSELKNTQSYSELQQGINRMAHVIEQILLLNRTSPETFQKNFSLINCDELCQEVIKDLYPDILKKGHDIEYIGSEIWLNGDAFTFSTLVQNLLSNAIKYTPSSGQIKVSLIQNDGMITFQVEDSGAGIDDSDYDRVFDRFYRVNGDQHQSNTIGCGLGLAIVKHIIELYADNDTFQNHSAITLDQSSQLGGLSVTVRFNSHDN